MLGSLGRWLRILGYDAAYDPRISRLELVRMARRERRTLLTRDRRLIRRRDLTLSLFVEHEDLGAQLRQVLNSLPQDHRRPAPLTRCLECNQLLERVKKSLVAERVPPYVYATQSEFCRCPQCERLFWAGTHRQRILERLTILLAE